MKYTQPAQLQIEKLNRSGCGIAHFKGYDVEVRYTAPGDCIQTKVKRRHREVYGEIISLLQPGPQRIEAKCPYFTICGGCKLQHIHYSFQLEFKKNLVQEAFQEAGFSEETINLIQPTIPSPQEFHYRNKMEFSFCPHRWLLKKEILSEEKVEKDFALGFHITGRHDRVLEVDQCFLCSPQILEVLKETQKFFREKKTSIYSTENNEGYLRFLMVREGKRTGELMVNLVTLEENQSLVEEYTHFLLQKIPEITTIVNNMTQKKCQISLGESEKIYWGKGFITEKLGDLSFRFSANSFFQSNTEQAEQMFTYLLKEGHLGKEDTIYDLYCGTGTISLFLAPKVKRVVGIELMESSLESARKNSQLNGIENCIFLSGDMSEMLTVKKEWMETHGNPDVVILDPPRPGLHPQVIQSLSQLSPRTILYVSCNPFSQAKNLVSFLESRPDYRLRSIQPFDMFPHTHHVESVAILDKQSL